MTGYGDARYQDERLTISLEVRTVNNRYLKISTKCPDVYASLEGDLERVVRDRISRGTVSVSVRVERMASDEDFQINNVALESYWKQLQQLAKQIQAPGLADLNGLLLLPGVVTDQSRRTLDLEADWKIIRSLLEDALQKLQAFRIEEGRSMQQELIANAKVIAQHLEQVVQLAPQVAADYRTRLLERVRQVLAEASAGAVSESDLMREVSIFAERTDINEEITRLKCHLEQFQTFMGESASSGRKLEFLSQEMFREVNTIGSKANNVQIAHAVVEMKAAIEKIREILQNVE